MLKISKESNPNYLAKIVQLENLQKVEGADRLQQVSIDFQTVVTGLTAQEGDVYVYFPVECTINKDFLSFTNSFRDKEKNVNKEKAGFFEDNGRVKPIRLRGVKSEGYIVPVEELEAFTGIGGLVKYVGQEFDTIGNIKMLEKYVIPTKNTQTIRQGKSPKFNRLIDGQVRLHTDTLNIRRNVSKINFDDIISITYKEHGTSATFQHVLVKKDLNWYEKILKKLGVNVIDTEYDLIITSRKVVKNLSKDPGFYGTDIWTHAAIKYDLKNKIPKGYSVYGELVGYIPNTQQMIQKGYDYGQEEGEYELKVYRITVTNPDGIVTELSMPEIIEFCERVGLETVHIYYHGTADDWLKERVSGWTNWDESFIKELEAEYTEKKCFMCKNDVWEEGVVIVKESLFSFDAMKLKSFNFLEVESKQLDLDVEDIESTN